MITAAIPIQIIDGQEIHEICYHCLEPIGEGATFNPKDDDDPITICQQCLYIAVLINTKEPIPTPDRRLITDSTPS